MTSRLILDAKYTDYYARVMAIIIESGSLFTAGFIIELVLYEMNNTAALVVLAILSQTMVCLT